MDNAASAVEHATAALAAGDRTEVDGVVHSAGDMAAALCTATARATTPVPWPMADALDRATRVPGVGQPARWGPVGRDLRRAAWLLVAVRGLGSRGGDSGMPELVVAFAALLAEIAAYHERSDHGGQAAAARRSAALLGGSQPRTGQGTTAPEALRRDSSGPGRTPRGSERAGTLRKKPINDGRGSGRGSSR